MKVCGYCNNEYNDSEPKCPVCGSALLKHNKHSDSAEAELKRIKEEIERKRKSRSLIIGIGAAAIVLAIVIAIFSITCYVTDPQRDIAKEANELVSQAEQQLNDGNYDEAIDILNRVNPEWDNYGKVETLRTKAVRGRLTATVSQYQASGDYEGVIEFINTNVSDINSDPEIKKIYDDSVAKYKEIVIQKADEYITAGDYSSATSVITTAVRIIGEDSDLNSKLVDINRSEIYATVVGQKNTGDYAAAITYVNERLDIVGTDSDILLVLSECENEYRKAVISEAVNAYQSSGYQAALSEINAGLAVMPDDSELLSEQAAYLACEPISLFSIEPYTKDGYTEHRSSEKDTMGNSYSDVLVGYGREGSSETYDIGSQYNRLTGTIFIPEWSKGAENTAGVRIYGDGALLYENMNIASDTKPTPFEVNISGVTDLKIVLYCGGDMWTKLSPLITDLTLQKTR